MRRGLAVVKSFIAGLRNSLAGQSGTSLPETALVLPVLILMLTGLVDLGRAYYYAISVSSAAHAAAV